jgi:hypothetical protein
VSGFRVPLSGGEGEGKQVVARAQARISYARIDHLAMDHSAAQGMLPFFHLPDIFSVLSSRPSIKLIGFLSGFFEQKS